MLSKQSVGKANQAPLRTMAIIRTTEEPPVFKANKVEILKLPSHEIRDKRNELILSFLDEDRTPGAFKITNTGHDQMSFVPNNTSKGFKESVHFLAVPPKIYGIFLDFSKNTVKFVLSEKEFDESVEAKIQLLPDDRSFGQMFVDIFGKKEEVLACNFRNCLAIIIDGLV
jgi:hypothetical protein